MDPCKHYTIALSLDRRTGLSSIDDKTKVGELKDKEDVHENSV